MGDFCRGDVERLLRGENKSDDEPVETQDLSKNQDEDHAHKEPGLLSCAPHACVSHNADRKACRQPAEAHTQPRSEVQETPTHRCTLVSTIRSYFTRQILLNFVHDSTNVLVKTAIKTESLSNHRQEVNLRGLATLGGFSFSQVVLF